MQVDISSIRYHIGASFKVNMAESWLPFMWSGEKIEFGQPVNVELEFINTGELLLVQGQIKTVLIVACSRCLEPVDLVLEVPFVMGYWDTEKQDATASDGEEIEVRLFSGDVIDLAPDIEETILLALPMKCLCSPYCRGLCPQCGQNLNVGSCTCHEEKIDPRLAVLRDFIKN
ncbi:MAG: DUF177 domain-containing protein [Firmicutes bacterium]|nr:DUF177 domain-containing protein [Bacillota bacterium]